MDDSNIALPFEFEDCDAFLVSLDENSSAFNQKNQASQTTLMTQPTLSDYVSMSAAMTDSNSQSDWSKIQHDYTSSSSSSSQQMNLYNQSTLDPFTLQQHHHHQHHQQHPTTHYSPNSTPLSSPLSAHSTSESDPNAPLLTTNMIYPSNISSPGNTIIPPYSGSASFDATYHNQGYPISPQYPPTQTASSISSPDGTDFTTSNTPFDYASLTASNQSNIQHHGLKMVPTILPHQNIPLQLSLSQSMPSSLGNSCSVSPPHPPPGFKQESPRNIFETTDDLSASPQYDPTGFNSPEDLSPKSYPQDTDYDSKDHSFKSSQRRESLKKERQHSTTKIDAKGNKISKPKKEKTSHNMIEKRYRTNINDKILALRDCVPSLRCVVNGTPRTSEELEGLTPASKLNKATVLTKATEYILHLQKRNNMLLKELHELQNHRSEPSGVLPNDMAPTGLPPNGMSAYPTLQSQNYQQLDNSFASKVMMCSMAGLMGAGLMNEGSDTQGLSFVPFLSYFSNLRLGPLDSSSLIYAFKLSLILGTVFYVLSPYFFNPMPFKKLDQASQPKSDSDSDSLSPNLHDIRKNTWTSNCAALNLPSDSLSSQVSSFILTLVQIFILSVFGSEGYDAFALNIGQQQLSVKQDSLSRAIDAQLCGGESNASFGSLFATFVQSFLLPASPMRYFVQAMHVSIMCHDVFFLSLVASKASDYFWSKAKQAALSAKPESDSTEENELLLDEFHLPKHIISLLDSQNVLNFRITQHLVNVVLNKPVSDGCGLGEEDEGYTSVVTDKSIRSAGDVLAALYANSLVHDVLLSVLENDEIDFRKLETCSNVSPPRSIVARRVAIVEALLLGPKDASYAKKAMEMLKEELNQQAWINKENGEPRFPSTFQVPLASARSRSNSITTAANSCDSTDTEDEFSSSDDHSMVTREDSLSGEDSLTEGEELVSTQGDHTFDFLSTSVKSSSIPFAVSQDSRLGIRFSLIICYLARNMTGPAFQLIQRVEINRQESIGLLGFVAMWKVLSEMYERKYTANRHKLEDLSAIARIWLGGNIGSEEGLSLEKLRHLAGDSVSMSKFFGGFECDMDEGYSTQ